jgi:AraC family transcriptional regulator
VGVNRIVKIRRPHECFGYPPAGAASSVKGPAQSIVRITPPDIARRHVTTLDTIQVDAVEVIRREPYEYEFKASCHMLIMSEHQERDDGETLLEDLPKSTLREFSRKLSFVPAGHRFFGWQKSARCRRRAEACRSYS